MRSRLLWLAALWAPALAAAAAASGPGLPVPPNAVQADSLIRPGETHFA